MLFAKNYYMQKKLILSASFVLFSYMIYAQGGFNLRKAVEGNTVFQSINCLGDSTYAVSAWSRDTTIGNNLDFELLKYSKNGELLQRTNFYTPECFVNIAQEADSYVLDYFVQHEQSVINNQYAHQLFWCNQDLDTLFTSFVQSPFIDSSWSGAASMNFQYAVLSSDTCLFYSIGVWRPETTLNDACIKKISPSGDELWTFIQSTEADPDACYALLPTSDGGVIAALFEGSTEDEPSKNKLIRLDSNGNPTWTLNNPGGYHSKFINCIIGDGSDVVISGRHVAPNITGYTTIAIVMKLDTLGNTHWARTFGEYEEFRRKDFTNVVQTCDGNYVAGGTWVSTPGSEEIPEGQNDQDVDEFAYILKLDKETGEIIWERKYRFLEIYGDQHTLIDLKATLDGGVIFCGEARDSYQILEGPIQQGWLVKLDECGCLVPGCDTLCSYVGCASDKPFFPAIPSHFIVGPNPASQFINIYFAGGALNLAQTRFEMFDLQGRLVYTFVPETADTTYMLSTEQFASGTYVLLLHHNGEKVQEQKVIVAEQ
jgi:Secretion system C-terminal sorting domain